MSSALEQLFDRHVGMALTRQCAFADTVPDPFWDWRNSLEENQSFVVFPNLGKFEVQFLGSESFISDTWLAGWANETMDDPYVRASITLRDNAEKLGDERIGGEYYSLEKINGDYIGVIACGVFEGGVYTSIPTIHEEKHVGDSFHIFFELPLINVSPIPMQRMTTVIQMMTESKQIFDYEFAIRSYLEQAGFEIAKTEESDNDDRKDIYCDELGREFNLECVSETSQKGEKVRKFGVDWTLTRDDTVQKPTRPDEEVESQWNYFVRAPLSRVVSNLDELPD